MASKTLFRSNRGKLLPATDAVNEAGGRAYALPPKHALAQFAATGCLNATFYASAERQLADTLALCAEVEPEFLAKTAVYCRETGFMKDMPALLCAVLSVKEPALLRTVFHRVIDDSRMLRNFVQIVRSGQVGRKSLGTLPKRLVREWLEARSDEELFRAAVGQAPTLGDVIKMVHPRPATPAREALYRYLIGKPAEGEAMSDGIDPRLPELVQDFERWKRTRDGEPPRVPFLMLTGLELGTAEWTAIARRATWQQTRMNLNTFARHGVFEQEGMTELIARRLADPEQVRRARVFPYQLLAAWGTADEAVPQPVRDALEAALETAMENVPEIGGKVYVFPDVSGSMSAPVTGYRKGATTKVRCVDVAALVAAAIVRRNPEAEVLPFDTQVHAVELPREASVLANAATLAKFGGGGTNCSLPLAELNRRGAHGDLVIYVSDSESWVDARPGRGTATMQEWQRFRERNPRARLACIDLTPVRTVQTVDREEILNVGGFSDTVFELVSLFAREGLEPAQRVGVIERIAL